MTRRRYLFDDEPSLFASVAVWHAWLKQLEDLPEQDDLSVVSAIRFAKEIIAKKMETGRPGS